MKQAILIALIALMMTGCSSGVVAPGPDSPASATFASAGSGNGWTWGSFSIAVSEDHSQAELIPIRNSSLHLNVNKFLEEQPCPDCLTIGKPIPQGDGTFKVKVWLRHPYPNHPMYTGFDVRGIVVFKATDYMKCIDYVVSGGGYGLLVPMLNPVLNYSDPAKGGAALLNADGYTFYLNPLLEYFRKWDPVNWWTDPVPILMYSKGKYACGDSPDSTVNPYILFSDGSPRRMFKVSDFMQRTFHIKPPSEGAFEFGYVVQACWVQPANTPVTNPEEDFPVEANCEDPWQVTAEQIKPIDYDVAFDEPIFKVRVKHRPMEAIWFAGILVPTLSTNSVYTSPTWRWRSVLRYEGPVVDAEYTKIIDDETTEIILNIGTFEMILIGDGLVPGHHLGILQVVFEGEDPEGACLYESQLYHPFGVLPVDVYVELPDG